MRQGDGSSSAEKPPKGLVRVSFRGLFRFLSSQVHGRGNTTSVPREDQKQPEMSRSYRSRRRLLALGFCRIGLVSGVPETGW